jgi:hypothetical protein
MFANLRLLFSKHLTVVYFIPGANLRCSTLFFVPLHGSSLEVNVPVQQTIEQYLHLTIYVLPVELP